MATTSFDQGPSHLSRGQACFSCRRRKMKCDGVHPICGQCKRARRDEDCEYTHGQKRARAEMLQESISQVESRIYQLEHPHLNHQPGLALQQPYQGRSSGRSASPRPINTAPWAAAEEPPNDVVQKVVDLFLSYSSEFGFFLNSSRFRQSALLRQPIGHQARPTPALLWAVYLCGLRLSKQPQLIAQEPMFLSRALATVANGLSVVHPQKVMHNLQAEILLAYYFFASGRFLEGKYHAASAVSLGLSSNLHMIRSANAPSSVLPPPQDAIEEGERIHACWVVMILDKAWAVVLSENPHLDHQQQNLVVDTPWPLEMDDYQQGRLSRTALYSNTLHKFINGVPTSDVGTSTIAMFSKASVLWQRADRLARDWKPDMPRDQSSAFQNSFAALDGLVDNFHAALIPPNHIPHPTPTMTRALIVAHSIAHTATIKLQGIPPLRAEPRARQKRLGAATAVLNIIVSIPLQHFAFINPVMGTVWLASCQVLLEEICTLRTQRSSNWQGEETGLVSLLTRTLGVLSSFTGTCPLLNYQISRIQEACAGM
ncbi:Zn(2)-C6 fungal-type domain-containing protein [Mycena venus]|uniref:Zn(2)-C6 fungal-type domain-containing protein n=1 Tax=Mycena venus TaxID=2733690 RepID=A0A8H6X5J8_9AGAR|nr:Zn(2)-C6 fungal-type domain-containing protein [Mycena venus]